MGSVLGGPWDLRVAAGPVIGKICIPEREINQHMDGARGAPPPCPPCPWASPSPAWQLCARVPQAGFLLRAGSPFLKVYKWFIYRVRNSHTPFFHLPHGLTCVEGSSPPSHFPPGASEPTPRLHLFLLSSHHQCTPMTCTLPSLAWPHCLLIVVLLKLSLRLES